MKSEENCSQCADTKGSIGQQFTNVKVENGDNPMKDHVDQVVPERVKLAHHVVEAEGCHCEWAVGLVRLLLIHRRPPKVVEEEVAPRNMAPQVLVVFDGCHIVKNKVCTQRVGVQHHASREQ